MMLGLKVKAIPMIKLLRDQYPDVEWKYDPYGGCYWGSDGSTVRRVAMCHCDDVCDHGGKWCRYFNGERTPEWV